MTAPLLSLETSYTAWHHWGALIAPVEAWRGGGVPYRDFPIQYGLGPTVLLMGTCGQDCWRGLYETSIIANALYFATLAGSAIILTARLPRGVRWLALLAMFCASFIWTGFSAQFAGPALTPAVAGLRFLSISALLFHILLAEHRQIRRDWIGHLLWLMDLFWSPETAFFGTMIWWPYLALRDAAAGEGKNAALIALAKGIVRGAAALLIGGCALALTLWLLSARSITITDFLAYIAYPPGMRPINPVGTIWIALASIALALPFLAQLRLSRHARPFYVCLLGFLAAGIYYLSRSHDNNILNLFPLMTLVLLSILANIDRSDASTRDFTRAFIHTALAAMVAFVTTFNFGPWIEGATQAGPFTVGPDQLISRFTPDHDDIPAILSPDAVVGLEYFREHKAGMVLLFDDLKILPRSSAGTAWTGVNNIANFEPLPGAMIVHYIGRGAAAYHRPGWILINSSHGPWVDAFKTAYDVRAQKTFGSYYAYYLVPRHQPAAEPALTLAALHLDKAKPTP